MITCPKCSKENQDHYKFCLGCGGKLEPAGGAGTPGPVAVGPSAMEIARTVLPPAPTTTTAAGELQAEANRIAPKP